MWQRAIIVLIFLSAGAILLMLSSNLAVKDTSKTEPDFSPVVDTTPTEAEDAQRLQLQIEATSAMRALAAKHLQRETKMNQVRLEALKRPQVKGEEVSISSDANPRINQFAR
jgi:hypothetical protein